MRTPDLCPAGCGRQQPAGMLMCPVCWCSVPRPLRLDVVNAWKAVQTRPRNHAATVEIGMKRIGEYRKARDAAIVAARERLIKKERKA